MLEDSIGERIEKIRVGKENIEHQNWTVRDPRKAACLLGYFEKVGLVWWKYTS